MTDTKAFINQREAIKAAIHRITIYINEFKLTEENLQDLDLKNEELENYWQKYD